MPNNIYRIDSGKTHGWQVRFERDGKPITKLFSDNVHGSRSMALKEAAKYRNKLSEALPEPKPGRLPREARRKIWKSQTRTGVPGIGYTFEPRANGSSTLTIQGYWKEGDSYRCTKRSVDAHGLESALMQVCRRVSGGLRKGPSFGNKKRHLSAQALFNAALPVLRGVEA